MLNSLRYEFSIPEHDVKRISMGKLLRAAGVLISLASPLVIVPRYAEATVEYKISYLYTTSATERDNAKAQGGQDEGTCCSVPMPPSASTPTLLYRLVGKEHGDHLFTTYLPEVDSAITKQHYTQEGNCCFVFSAAVPGSIPLYRLRGTKTGDRFYTTSASERDAALRNQGYVLENTCCFVPSSASQQTTPLYRLENSKKKLHFYTISPVERDNAVLHYGYTSEGTCCLVIATAPDVMPLYRMDQPKSQDHFYTVSITERSGLLNHGYQSAGICCYVHSPQVTGVPLFRLDQSGYNVHFYTVSSAESGNANKIGFNNEGTCCSVAAVNAPNTEPLFRLSYISCRVGTDSPWETIKDPIANGGEWPQCPSPPKVTFSASPNEGYNCLGVVDTLSWTVDQCDTGCQITLDGEPTGYARSVAPVHLANLPTASSYPIGPTDIWYFTLTAASPFGTVSKKKELSISPPNTCGSSANPPTLRPFYFAVKALSDLVQQCTWVQQPADNQSDAQRTVSTTYGSDYVVTPISQDDFNQQRGCP